MKNAVESFKKSDLIFRLAIENAFIGKALVSPEGKFIYVNAALCKIVGYSEEELLATDFQTITHPDDLELDLNYVHQMLNKEIENYQMEKRYCHKDGHIVWILLSVSLVRHDDGAPYYFISQIQDLSERKKAEREHEQLIGQLIESNSELERFAFIASHDLREPMRVVCNFADLLQSEYAGALGNTGAQYLQSIANASERMHTLITKLLDYARIPNENDPHEWFVSSDCLEYVKENLREAMSRANAVVNAENLPAIYTNQTRFSLLLQNLISNGVKYKKPSTSPVVTIRAVEDDTSWIFSVSDNGIGIRECYREQIFEPFKRLHAPEEYEGTGMGLAICRKIIEKMKGKIWVDSNHGSGSTFYFTIPKTKTRRSKTTVSSRQHRMQSA